jgi:hypothetical protein
MLCSRSSFILSRKLGRSRVVSAPPAAGYLNWMLSAVTDSPSNFGVE